MSDLPDEWLEHCRWADWLDAWWLVGLAVEQWATLYEPFLKRRPVAL